MKTCPGCLCRKRVSSFHKNKRAPDGLQYHCISCRQEIDSRPEKLKQDRERYHATKPRFKNNELKRKYGITLEQVNALFLKQGKSCAICKRNTAGGNGWHVDHRHVDSRVRGILCCLCNPMLGYAKDNAAILIAGANYLRRFE